MCRIHSTEIEQTRDEVGPGNAEEFLLHAHAYSFNRLLLNGEVYHSKAYHGTQVSISSTVAFWHRIAHAPAPVKRYGTVLYYICLTGPDYTGEEIQAMMRISHWTM